ncbi:Hypothetical protein POVN_LOCUS263, partial [uncultured virus]
VEVKDHGYTLISDTFSERRISETGEGSKILKLTCMRCSAHLMMYQKDGGGDLHRCYYDRILDRGTGHLHGWKSRSTAAAIKKQGDITCDQCGTKVGELVTYSKYNECRLAYELRVTKFTL